MNMKEFHATVIQTETGSEIQFDVRPFGDRQGEAIDSYLHDLLMSAQYGVASSGPRMWVLLHDSTAVIPQSTSRWLGNLRTSSFNIEIRPA
jgi:hypothetical protein